VATVLRIVLAQLNTLAGDVEGNAHKVAEAARQARASYNADIVVYPELTLCGYPAEDLLLRPSLDVRIKQALALLKTVEGVDLVLGMPWRCQQRGLMNQAVVLRQGEVVARYSKHHLPNYQVFDEKRYFAQGEDAVCFSCKGVQIGLTICEDVWFPDAVAALKSLGAQLVLNLSASPFHQHKQAARHKTLQARCRETGLPVVYVNQVGGQDDLVFDGGSFVINGDGTLAATAPSHEACLLEAVFDPALGAFAAGPRAKPKPACAQLYDSLVLGVRDYVGKNGFGGVILGLSGGIDSALTLAIAVDALGAEHVEAVMMPFHYTSSLSRELAKEQASLLGIKYREVPICALYDACLLTLGEEFQTAAGPDVAEENIQARCRGLLLMALSNRQGQLVLTTGNKSEMAVGYATLYGDMVGGFAALKDVYKTSVIELSRWRNTLSRAIPEQVIARPPSAELSPGQLDADSLPPYEVLDAILQLYIEESLSAEQIVERGYDRDRVYKTVRQVDSSEYKRRQSPIGTRVTPCGFGRDRRYPITHGWNPGA